MQEWIQVWKKSDTERILEIELDVAAKMKETKPSSTRALLSSSPLLQRVASIWFHATKVSKLLCNQNLCTGMVAVIEQISNSSACASMHCIQTLILACTQMFTFLSSIRDSTILQHVGIYKEIHNCNKSIMII